MQLLVTLGFITRCSIPMGGGTSYPSFCLCAFVFKTNGSMCCLCFLDCLDGGVVHGLPHAARGWRANFSCRTLSVAFFFTCGLVANQQFWRAGSSPKRNTVVHPERYIRYKFGHHQGRLPLGNGVWEQASITASSVSAIMGFLF